MKVVYTEPALSDLDEITSWLKQNYPGLGRAVERRLKLVVAHIARWPESARRSMYHPDVHVAPLGRYPYKFSIESRLKRWRFCTSIMRRADLGMSKRSRRSPEAKAWMAGTSPAMTAEAIMPAADRCRSAEPGR